MERADQRERKQADKEQLPTSCASAGRTGERLDKGAPSAGLDGEIGKHHF
jgi:hypothetical protein